MERERTGVLNDFEVLLRGNVVELAVAVVIATAFGALVSGRRLPADAAHRGDLREAGLLASPFTINGSVFQYGCSSTR